MCRYSFFRSVQQYDWSQTSQGWECCAAVCGWQRYTTLYMSPHWPQPVTRIPNPTKRCIVKVCYARRKWSGLTSTVLIAHRSLDSILTLASRCTMRSCAFPRISASHPDWDTCQSHVVQFTCMCFYHREHLLNLPCYLLGVCITEDYLYIAHRRHAFAPGLVPIHRPALGLYQGDPIE